MQRINLFSLFPLKSNYIFPIAMVTKAKPKAAAAKKKAPAKKTAAKKSKK